MFRSHTFFIFLNFWVYFVATCNTQALSRIGYRIIGKAAILLFFCILLKLYFSAFYLLLFCKMETGANRLTRNSPRTCRFYASVWMSSLKLWALRIECRCRSPSEVRPQVQFLQSVLETSKRPTRRLLVDPGRRRRSQRLRKSRRKSRISKTNFVLPTSSYYRFSQYVSF